MAPSPTPSALGEGVGGWGWWLIIIMIITENVLLHRPVATIFNLIPHPSSALLASHPTYSLLGFSAARAPKFTQLWPRSKHIKVLGFKIQFLARGYWAATCELYQGILRAPGSPRELWGILRSSREPWGALGKPWEALGIPGEPWGSPGEPWGSPGEPSNSIIQ